MQVNLKRFSDDGRQTLGTFTVTDGTILKAVLCSMELPWLGNANGISCIPAATYLCKRFNSPKHGLCFLITGVPGRSMCEIHAANFSRQLLGCIAVGRKHADIDNDGLKDVTDSRAALDLLLSILPETFFLTITNAPINA